MKKLACAKINLGLNIVARRPDGYHDLETVFYPIPLFDELEVEEIVGGSSREKPYELIIEGDEVDCPDDDNLVVKAYRMLAADFTLPPVRIRLRKQIPSQAGLGGGSSDATTTLLIINEMFGLKINKSLLQSYASRLGADCPFFVEAEPVFATGIGNIFTPLPSPIAELKGKTIIVVKPDIAVSTREAYAMLSPRKPEICCREVVGMRLEEWKERLRNDFEEPVFSKHIELRSIKETLYNAGALYAQMSGSGSAIFGIFDEEPKEMIILSASSECKTFTMRL